MFREISNALLTGFGRPMTLKRGAQSVSYYGMIRGLRADDFIQSAEQGDALCVIPAAQVGLVPKKFDRIIAAGHEYVVQSVRECYAGSELAMYKALIRG